ncbi:hypothetical protein GCM10028818_43530 [Spirosoma horti]
MNENLVVNVGKSAGFVIQQLPKSLLNRLMSRPAQGDELIQNWPGKYPGINAETVKITKQPHNFKVKYMILVFKAHSGGRCVVTENAVKHKKKWLVDN